MIVKGYIEICFNVLVGQDTFEIKLDIINTDFLQ